MIPLTLSEVAAATEGRLGAGADHQAVVRGPVVIDSRQAAPGSLFVALPGERVDGHTYVEAALAGGAVAALAGAASVAAARPPLPADHLIVVDDPLLGLGALARAVCDRLPALTVVAVTGSSGKTSTKDLLARLLGDLAPTVAPRSSFNNEIGVPLTALECTGQTRFLIAEMGARQPGNLTYLSRVTPPDLAVVLNVGSAHVGVFGSLEATAATKGELPAALGVDGVAVLNADDPLVRAMAGRTAARVVLFGTSERAQVRAAGIRVDDQARARFTLHAAQGEVEVTLGLHGEHHVSNALAAAAVALEVGLSLPRIAELLAGATAVSSGRMALSTRSDGVVVLNDAYNANPESVRAALRALAALRRPGGRTWAVLGEMLELGERSSVEHASVGRLAGELGIDRVVAVGEGARALASSGMAWVPAADDALALLDEELAAGDVVLVKASRAIGLDRLADALLVADRPRPVGQSRQEAAR